MKKKIAKDFERAHVFYSGRVQGVGFRYTAESLALDLGLRGWVKNTPDGRVELVCEGRKESIERFFLRVQGSLLGPHIKKTDVRWEPARHEFSDFRVEFNL